MEAVIGFMQAHNDWLVPIVFVLGFCESFSFVSLLVPATTILLGVGVLIGASGLGFWSIWCATAFGAMWGGWLAYELGLRYQGNIIGMWPMCRYPDAMIKGARIFHRFGAIAVFASRFSAPLRATVPMIAGIYELPFMKFQIGNIGSAVLWTTAILAPGMIWPR